jgi:hypothetical protein
MYSIKRANRGAIEESEKLSEFQAVDV